MAASEAQRLNIHNLGTLDAPVLLYGGPYSNLQATKAMFAWADRTGIPPERRICTGDIMAHCADPAATLALVRKAGGAVLAGNIEKQLAAGAPDCGCGCDTGSACDQMAKAWYAHADASLNPEARDWLAARPERIVLRHCGRRYVVIHGGAGDIARFLWPITPEDDFWHEISILQEEVGAIDGVIAGHCGIPFSRSIDGIRWINAGSIGMPPHDGQPETSFAVLEDGEVRIERLEYDFAAAAAAMAKAGLTQGYETALKTGFWPAEDVLPKAMRR